MKTHVSKISLGPELMVPPQGSWRVTRIFGGEGFLTMSSPDPKLSKTNFSFTIGWVEIKIFHFWDIGLEVERSQLVEQKISKWVLSHLFFSPPRTHSNSRKRIWMSITHFMNVRRFTSYRFEGCETFLKSWVCIWVRYELGITYRCDW